MKIREDWWQSTAVLTVKCMLCCKTSKFCASWRYTNTYVTYSNSCVVWCWADIMWYLIAQCYQTTRNRPVVRFSTKAAEESQIVCFPSFIPPIRPGCESIFGAYGKYYMILIAHGFKAGIWKDSKGYRNTRLPRVPRRNPCDVLPRILDETTSSQ